MIFVVSYRMAIYRYHQTGNELVKCGSYARQLVVNSVMHAWPLANTNIANKKLKDLLA